MSDLCTRSGRSLRWVAAAAMALLLTAGLGVQAGASAGHPRPVLAAEEELSPLAAWDIRVDVKATMIGGGYLETWRSTFVDSSAESFDMSWTGSRAGSARFDCPVSGQNGYDVAGSGTGGGVLGLGSGGIPVDWGLPADRAYVQFLPVAEGSYTYSGTSVNCDGETTPTSGSEGPHVAIVFVPGTFEELDAAPVGEVREASYERVQSGGAGVAETTTVRVRAEKLVATACVGGVNSRIDTFRASNLGAEKPRLQFELATAWCFAGARVLVRGVSPKGTTLLSPLYFAIAAGVRELYTFHTDWKKSSFTVNGSVVTGSGTLELCMGVPVIGKIKWVKKFSRAFRYAAGLLDKIDVPKLRKVADGLAVGMRAVADAVDLVIRYGGRAAKYAARKALELVVAGLERLPQKVQLKMLLATVGVIADHSSSQRWAKRMLRDLAEDQTVDRSPKPDPLVRLFSDKLMCWSGWRPRIRQDLTATDSDGYFVDRSGDYPGWVVRRAGRAAR